MLSAELLLLRLSFEELLGEWRRRDFLVEDSLTDLLRRRPRSDFLSCLLGARCRVFLAFDRFLERGRSLLRERDGDLLSERPRSELVSSSEGDEGSESGGDGSFLTFLGVCPLGLGLIRGVARGVGGDRDRLEDDEIALTRFRF